MKTRMFTALAAVSLIVLLGACSSSSPDASDTTAGGSKQVAKSGNDGDTPPGETKECEALMTFNSAMSTVNGKTTGWSSVMNNSLTADDLDGYFAPVKAVLDNLPADFQQAYPILDKTASASIKPGLNDDEVLAMWADPDANNALVTMVDTTRSVCGLPDGWMKDTYQSSGSN